MSEIISQDVLRQSVRDWIASGKTVSGPARIKPGLVLYIPLKSADTLHLDANVRPSNSIKELFFPKNEELYRYRIQKNQVELLEPVSALTEQVVIGARPCDAAALPILDHVFNWDFKDGFYNRRRATTTIVTLTCTSHDESCFCTSVGLSPAAENGSDALLFELGNGEYEVHCLTDKGKALFAGKTTTSEKKAATPSGPEIKVLPEKVRAFARDHFDDPVWQKNALACFGCGTCAYSCPTCHCFDIVDEGHSKDGVRARNWDSCQFAMFTLHASGHNPRANQGARQRQRIYHKFHIYPEKFGQVLCTGCGNCTRNCPAGLGVLTVATEISHG